jgi:hypothetical protein
MYRIATPRALTVDQAEQTFGIGFRQGGGGFVEDQQPGLQRERTGQHQQLAVGAAQALDWVLQRQVQAEPGGNGFGAVQQAFAVEQKIGVGLAKLIEQQVLGHTQARGDGIVEALMHRHNADPPRRQWRSEALALPIDPELPGIRR